VATIETIATFVSGSVAAFFLKEAFDFLRKPVKRISYFIFNKEIAASKIVGEKTVIELYANEKSVQTVSEIYVFFRNVGNVPTDGNISMDFHGNVLLHHHGSGPKGYEYKLGIKGSLIEFSLCPLKPGEELQITILVSDLKSSSDPYSRDVQLVRKLAHFVRPWYATTIVFKNSSDAIRWGLPIFASTLISVVFIAYMLGRFFG
jgi:hypothetical protein